jgi:hypothetical protein
MHGESHYRPWEIQRLTDAELLAVLDDDVSERRPPTGSTPLNSHEEVIAHIERLRSMTALERLEAAMEED